jgi:transient receptor potential cation channel subfamily M protein 3
MERLYDFEEECVDGLLQTKETDSMQRTEARIKTTLEVVEELRSKMEDMVSSYVCRVRIWCSGDKAGTQ